MKNRRKHRFPLLVVFGKIKGMFRRSGTMARRRHMYGQNGRTVSPWRRKAEALAAFLPKLRLHRSYLSSWEKRKKYGRRAVKIGIALLFFVVSVGILREPFFRFVETVEFFRVKNIVVQGCFVTSPREIKETADIDYSTSMFAVSGDKVMRALAALEWVKNVDVRKQWPGEVFITVREYQPSALLVQQEDGRETMVYVDGEGEVIAPVTPGADLDYPVITGGDSVAPEEFEALYVDAIRFLAMVSRNDPNLPAQLVSEINFDPEEGLVIRLVEFPFPIYFGKGEVRKKYNQLREVLAVLYKKRSSNIDIRRVDYIRMEYYNNQVLVARSNSG